MASEGGAGEPPQRRNVDWLGAQPVQGESRFGGRRPQRVFHSARPALVLNGAIQLGHLSGESSSPHGIAKQISTVPQPRASTLDRIPLHAESTISCIFGMHDEHCRTVKRITIMVDFGDHEAMSNFARKSKIYFISVALGAASIRRETRMIEDEEARRKADKLGRLGQQVEKLSKQIERRSKVLGKVVRVFQTWALWDFRHNISHAVLSWIALIMIAASAFSIEGWTKGNELMIAFGGFLVLGMLAWAGRQREKELLLLYRIMHQGRTEWKGMVF